MEINIGECYSIKLNSGEEVVARVKERITDWIVIENPVSVAPGAHGMGLVPSLFTADANELVRLNINSISIYAITDSTVKMKYIEAVTGLTVPDKKILHG